MTLEPTGADAIDSKIDSTWYTPGVLEFFEKWSEAGFSGSYCRIYCLV